MLQRRTLLKLLGSIAMVGSHLVPAQAVAKISRSAGRSQEDRELFPYYAVAGEDLASVSSLIGFCSACNGVVPVARESDFRCTLGHIDDESVMCGTKLLTHVPEDFHYEPNQEEWFRKRNSQQ